MIKETIARKLQDMTLRAGVIGLGYVGLPLAVEIAAAGFQTVGFDVMAKRVDMVNRGENYIGDVKDAVLQQVVSKGMLSATTDFSGLRDVDFIAICVPTPLDTHQQPDLSYVEKASASVSEYLAKGSVVVLESTVFPGTTEELVAPLLEAGSGLSCGQDFYLGFSPERVDPGNAHYHTGNTPKVVGGIGTEATDTIAAVYRAVLDGDVMQVSSPAVAEMEKILENTYRNVNIGLINEMAQLCHLMDIPIWEVIEAAKTKPYGFQAFYPGPGLGGHCIPLDPYYLSWKAREYSFHTSMIESSMTINDRMPAYCASRIMKLLNHHKKTLNGARILVLGVAYKQDISDWRESPAIRVIRELEKEGAVIQYFDPYVTQYTEHGRVHESLPALTSEVLQACDLAVITTAHGNVDYGMVQRYAPLVFDTRNAMNDVTPRDNIELL